MSGELTASTTVIYFSSYILAVVGGHFFDWNALKHAMCRICRHFCPLASELVDLV